MNVDSVNSLGPGFRFHPTDDELLRFYLKRKILNKPSFDAISVIDIYRSEPWDLPDNSKLKSSAWSGTSSVRWTRNMGMGRGPIGQLREGTERQLARTVRFALGKEWLA
ncbi:hypothetical protein CRYUN_Cryun01aG0067400 [Craigia yunnanensis]